MTTIGDVLALPGVTYAERRTLPDAPGVYLAVVDGSTVAYVGSTGSLRARWRCHDKRQELQGLGHVRIHYIEADVPTMAGLEQAAIDAFAPALNQAKALNPVGPDAPNWLDLADEPVVMLPDAARELGMSHVSVWRHVDSGKLKARKVGPIWLIKRADLEAFKRLDRRVGRPRRPRPPAAE